MCHARQVRLCGDQLVLMLRMVCGYQRRSVDGGHQRRAGGAGNALDRSAGGHKQSDNASYFQEDKCQEKDTGPQ